jgi:hypothetical protein
VLGLITTLFRQLAQQETLGLIQIQEVFLSIMMDTGLKLEQHRLVQQGQ